MAKKLTDYYRILQVDPEADPDVVEAAYKRLARKYHPDLNPEPDANQRMKDINCAYETLGDPEKRAEYHLDWQREFGARHYAGAEFSPQWLDGIRLSVTFQPAEVRFEGVPWGQVVEADVVMSLSRRPRREANMRPHQSWIKAKFTGRRKNTVVIRITVDTSGLRGGVTYEGSVAITSLMPDTLRIPVRVSVAPEPRPILKVEPLWLDAGSVRRSDPPMRLTLNIRNAGDGEFEGEIRVKHGWLAVDKDQFRGKETAIAVSLNPGALKTGRSYTGKIEVSSNGGLCVVPVKVMVKQELPNLPPLESEAYWPAVLGFLRPENAWEKEFVAHMKALSELRGWIPAASQQSTLMYMLARDMDKD